MLTPSLAELLELRHQAYHLRFFSARKPHALLSGLYASVFRGQGMNFEEVREYRYGDEVRNIDWRVTARMGKPYLKVYLEERERQVAFCLDVGAHMQFGTRQTFKSVQAARVVALLGWSAQAHGDRVSGLLFGQGTPQFFQANRDKRAFWRLLRALTLPPTQVIDSGMNITSALTLLDQSTVTGALLFIIADFQQVVVSDLQFALGRLRQHHEIVLIGISDPADYDLPAVGLVQFLAPDGQLITINTDDKQGCKAYRQSWLNQQRAIQKLADRFYIDFFNISTQEDAYQSLMRGLHQRLKRQQNHR